MAKKKARKNRPEAGKQRTKQRKDAKKALQTQRERANAALRAAGKPVPSEVLWGDLKTRMADKRSRLRDDRNQSAWRKIIPAPRARTTSS